MGQKWFRNGPKTGQNDQSTIAYINIFFRLAEDNRLLKNLTFDEEKLVSYIPHTEVNSPIYVADPFLRDFFPFVFINYLNGGRGVTKKIAIFGTIDSYVLSLNLMFEIKVFEDEERKNHCGTARVTFSHPQDVPEIDPRNPIPTPFIQTIDRIHPLDRFYFEFKLVNLPEILFTFN